MTRISDHSRFPDFLLNQTKLTEEDEDKQERIKDNNHVLILIAYPQKENLSQPLISLDKVGYISMEDC